MSFPGRVKIVEVGPRDGLQNETQSLPIGVKIELIDRLGTAGLAVIESGSFVSPKWVPQMSSSGEVYRGIDKRPGVGYPVLVPNLKGLEAALEAGVDEIAIFTAASETFSQKNINSSIDKSIERYRQVVTRADAENLKIRGYISCVLGCPYEGAVSVDKVATVADQLLELGCYEISLGDTIGVGTPGQARLLVEYLADRIPVSQLAAHFHDTYGQALANLYAVLECGIAVIDSSVAGLGGCPYAKGATGNVATEDVIYMLNGMQIETGVDLDKLREAGRFISDYLGREPASKVALALQNKQ